MTRRRPQGPARLLYIDDSPSDRTLLRRAVARHGHDLVTASSGEIGLELVDRMSFDAVVVDLWLDRGLPGPAVVQVLAERGYAGPVVVLTGDDNPGEAELRRLGATAVLLKTFDLDALADAVLAAVGL